MFWLAVCQPPFQANISMIDTYYLPPFKTDNEDKDIEEEGFLFQSETLKHFLQLPSFLVSFLKFILSKFPFEGRILSAENGIRNHGIRNFVAVQFDLHVSRSSLA
jgi:hypothetical protein